MMEYSRLPVVLTPMLAGLAPPRTGNSIEHPRSICRIKTVTKVLAMSIPNNLRCSRNDFIGRCNPTPLSLRSSQKISVFLDKQHHDFPLWHKTADICMAEAIGLAASLIGIASFGIKIVTTLNTLTTLHAQAEHRIITLTGDISLTSSILKGIGDTIKQYEGEVGFTVSNFATAKESCEKIFQALNKALEIVKRDETASLKNNGKATMKKKSLNIWDKLKFALGGEDELVKLLASIETSKSNLQLLLGSLNFALLKSLDSKYVVLLEISLD